MKITAHCLVKNEEKFIWYSIMSIVDYVDEVLVWDNGSSDLTSEIIKSIKSPKIKFREVPGMKLEVARQEMINQTKADWIFILDGDEIWYTGTIRELVASAKDSNCKAIITPDYMLVGDMFHYQEERAGRYNLAGRVGHYNIRMIKNDSTLRVFGIYGNEGFSVGGIKVQDFPKEKLLFLNLPYLHASFLKRGKYEIGENFPLDFYYPEAFFFDRPSIVPSVWEPMSLGFKLVSFFATPLRKIYRRTLMPFAKHGY